MILTTDRLLLREFEEEDVEIVLAYRSDPRYYPRDGNAAEETRTLVRRFITWQKERPRSKFQLAVVPRAEDHLIGNCGIRMENADAREASLGYELAPHFWGRGYATEAARAVLAFGFEELGVHRVWARCVAENEASARVLEKIGMRREGRLRENERVRDRRWDTLLYGMLDREWRPTDGGRLERYHNEWSWTVL